jgi:hypothetical protein
MTPLGRQEGSSAKIQSPVLTIMVTSWDFILDKIQTQNKTFDKKTTKKTPFPCTTTKVQHKGFSSGN